MSFDEMYDEMLHDEFRSGSSRGAHAAKGPVTGLARFRTVGLVGAGGLACATAGAFLGGLGGYFTLSPASAHSITSSSEQVSLAAAANANYVAPGRHARRHPGHGRRHHGQDDHRPLHQRRPRRSRGHVCRRRLAPSSTASPPCRPRR